MVKKLRAKYPGHYWQLCLGALLFFLSFNMILPELPGHLRMLGGSGQLGWIISIFAVGALLARPFSGWVTDRFGRKWSIAGGSLLCALTALVYPFTGVISVFFAVRAIHGFFAGFSPTGFTAYTTDIIPKENRGEALGWQGMFSNIGASAGFALGSLVAAWTGTHGLYLISALIGFAGFFILLPLPETRPHAAKEARFSLREIFYLPVWRPSLLMMLVCIPLGGILLIMPDYTLSLGYHHKGVFLSTYITASLFVRIFSGKLSDRIGRPFSTAIGNFAQLVSMMLLLLFPGKTMLLAAAVCYGIGQGFNAPGLFAWGGDDSDEKTRGRALSMIFIALESGIFIGGLGSGHLYSNNISHMPDLFLFWALISLAGLLFSLLFIRQHKKRGNLPLSDISEV